MIARSLPDHPFPPYAFVPGRHPHPVRDPDGHLHGSKPETISPLDPQQPGRSAEFLWAVDLFNSGYYWEAHEAWEGLWHAAGRDGPVAVLLKALIKLAAAGVKSREGNLTGVQRHAARAAELLRTAVQMPGEAGPLFQAIHGDRLITFCDDLAHHPVIDATPTVGGLPVLDVRIDLAG